MRLTPTNLKKELEVHPNTVASVSRRTNWSVEGIFQCMLESGDVEYKPLGHKSGHHTPEIFARNGNPLNVKHSGTYSANGKQWACYQPLEV